MFKNVLHMIGLTAAMASAWAAEWMTDLDAAKTKAAAENKAVLIDFTGSDWCSWCIKLKKEVFDTPEFDAYAKDKFVLVEIDLPNAPKITPEQLKKNQELCKQYQVDGFPTIMVLNPQGNVVGGFVGGRPSVAAATAELDKALANAGLIAAASQLQGVDRAKSLMEAYKNMPEEFSAPREALGKEIAANDPDNATGIQDIAKAEQQRKDVLTKITSVRQDTDQALAVINKAVEEACPANEAMFKNLKMQILYAKLSENSEKADTVDDVMALKGILQQIIDCMPADKREASQKALEKRFEDPESLLKELKAGRTD